MTPETAFGGVSAGLSLLANIAEIIRTAKRKGQALGLSDILLQIPSQAYMISGQIIGEIESLETRLADYNTDQTIEEMKGDYLFWGSSSYRAVRNLNSTIAGITNSISNLLDDLVAVSNCVGDEETVAMSFRETSQSSLAARQLLADPEITVSKILVQLREAATNIRGQFGDLTQN